MVAATGGRLTRTQATTIHTQRHIAADIIMPDMGIIMVRPITTPPLELMAGKGLLTAPMVRLRQRPGTILIPALMREAVQSRRRTERAAPHKGTIRIPARTLKRDKIRARQASGVAPICHAVTRVPRWDTPRVRTER